jgi:outer membrane protein assembly factor BamB
VLLVHDAEGVRGLNVKTGFPAWKTGPEDAGWLLHSPPGAKSAGRGFLQGRNWIGIGGGEAGRLVALNLDAQGRLEWSRRADELAADKRVLWSFAGTCCDAGDGCAVSLLGRSESGEQTLQLVRTDAAGRVPWRTSPALQFHAPLSEHMVLSGARLIWRLGNQVLALDPLSGRTLWETRLAPPAPGDRHFEAADDLCADETRVLVLQAGALTLLSAANGQMHWQAAAPDARRILGICDATAVLSGNALAGMHLGNGRTTWRVGGGHNGEAGRGLLLGRSVLWLTAEGLWAVDALAGQVLQRDFLSPFLDWRGGDLTLAGDILLIAQPGKLTALQVKLRTQ